MMYKEKFPTNIQEGVWDEKTCIRRQGGYTLYTDNLPTDLKWLPKGAVLAIRTDGKVALVKTAMVYENAASAATSVKVNKNHALKVGDTIAGAKINAIDTTNESYDTLTLAAGLSAKADKDAVLVEATAKNVIGLNYATVMIDDAPSCTPTIQAYEIEEDTLPYPIDSAIKSALTSRHAFKIQ